MLEAEIVTDILLAPDFIWLVRFFNEGGLEVDLVFEVDLVLEVVRLAKEGTGFG